AGMVGELLFAEELHGTSGDPQVDELLAPVFGPADERARIRAEFLRICMAQVDRAQTELVGFSASCNQLLPSLWLAGHIKPVRPRASGRPATSRPHGPTSASFSVARRARTRWARRSPRAIQWLTTSSAVTASSPCSTCASAGSRATSASSTARARST